METITVELTKNEIERIQFALANSSIERKNDYYMEAQKNKPDQQKLKALAEIQSEYVVLFNKFKALK